MNVDVWILLEKVDFHCEVLVYQRVRSDIVDGNQKSGEKTHQLRER